MTPKLRLLSLIKNKQNKFKVYQIFLKILSSEKELINTIEQNNFQIFQIYR